MSQSLLEYAAWLDERKLGKAPAPTVVTPKAAPFLKPLGGIRGVMWNLYGTLLFITDGKLLLSVPQPARMQVALEKTIQQFNLWVGDSQQPGKAWEELLRQYTRLIDERRAAATPKAGETPEINVVEVWKTLIERLKQKDYSWDENQYGDLDDFSEKVAWFFQASLQGVTVVPQALATLQLIAGSGFVQGLATNAQAISLDQLHHALKTQGPVPSLRDLFIPRCIVLSYREGVQQPSNLILETCIEQFEREGVTPGEIACVGTRVHEELAPAKKLGLRAVLFAGDKASMQATSADMKDPAARPDRIITELSQLRQLLFPDPEGE